MGMELAGTVAVFCLVGYWIDSKFDTSPWWMVIFSFLGIIGGLYNMIRQSVHEMFTDEGGKDGEDKARKGPKQDVDS
jgi:F0F1-type ATP synthase assembly protein I